MVKGKKDKRKKEEELPRTIDVFPYQTGYRKNLFRDIARPALPPGKRLSATGKKYWETRKNRSDILGKRL